MHNNVNVSQPVGHNTYLLVQISAALISLTVIFIHTFVALAKGNSTDQNNIYKDLGVSHFLTV